MIDTTETSGELNAIDNNCKHVSCNRKWVDFDRIYSSQIPHYWYVRILPRSELALVPAGLCWYYNKNFKPPSGQPSEKVQISTGPPQNQGLLICPILQQIVHLTKPLHIICQAPTLIGGWVSFNSNIPIHPHSQTSMKELDFNWDQQTKVVSINE